MKKRSSAFAPAEDPTYAPAEDPGYAPADGAVYGLATASRHRALAAISRVRMLHLLSGAPDGLTVADVASATGLHPNTVRAHLDQLAESGFVTRHRQPDGSPGRPAWRYRAADQPGNETPVADRAFRDLSAALVGHLARTERDPREAGVRAGQAWGRALATPLRRVTPFSGLVGVLDQLGFSPTVTERTGGSAVLHLRSCPFLELAQAAPDVVCGLHLGVIGGALGALGGSSADAELHPFAAPGACVVTVATGRTRTRRR